MDLIAALATSTPASIVLKATMTLVAGLIAVACARRARASLRHAMLTATLAVALALPAGVLLLPVMAIEIPVAGATAGTSSPVAVEQPPSSPSTHQDLPMQRNSRDVRISSSIVVASVGPLEPPFCSRRWHWLSGDCSASVGRASRGSTPGPSSMTLRRVRVSLAPLTY
jgi:hypothetical protein